MISQKISDTFQLFGYYSFCAIGILLLLRLANLQCDDKTNGADILAKVGLFQPPRIVAFQSFKIFS